MNVGRQNIYGGELEIDALLPAGFQLSGSLAYTHPKYQSFIDPITGFDRSRQRFTDVAKWQASLSPSWTHDFAFGSVLLRADAAYQSNTPLEPDNFLVNAAGQTVDVVSGAVVSPQDAAAYLRSVTDRAHILVNARVALTVLDGRLDLSIWGRNLTKRRDRIATLLVPELGLASSITREPRTFGATATVKLRNLF